MMFFPAVKQDLLCLNSQSQVRFNCNLGVQALCLRGLLLKPVVHRTIACTYLDMTC